MHLLRTQARSNDEAEAAVDLGQTPGDIVFLSFSDSDLGIVAACADEASGPLSLRLACLAQLRHPYSVDLYLDGVAAKARFVLVRLLGGLDYWRYGIEELARLAREKGFDLAILPGDHRADDRLDAASTLPVADLRRLWAFFQEGGRDNAASLLGWIGSRLGNPCPWREPEPLAAAGRFEAACRAAPGGAGLAAIIFYRSLLLSADTAPIMALADALAARGLGVVALYVTSLKDERAIKTITDAIAATPLDIVLNTTAFSARLESGSSVLDGADVPILQAVLAGSSEAQWRANPRGLGAADLAMNVVLPEMDGRLVTAAISCKAESARSAALEFTRLVHRPIPSRVDFVARLAANWVLLRKTPARDRRIACILSDYPLRGGREGYAVGLDTPASVAAIAEALRSAGYAIGALPDGGSLMATLSSRTGASLAIGDYRRLLAALPEAFTREVIRQWGEPEADPGFAEGTLRLRLLQAGRLIVALQPNRGSRATRKADYHDSALPPCHAYIGFYLWLRHLAQIHAVVQCGTHGTLEWLPGKAVALDETCAPEALLGPIPLIYPFIVNNPGEAAQAKRRNAAVTIGHMTPPLMDAGLHGGASEIEALFDEYAEAESLDPKRAKLIARAILERAGETGLAQECGIDPASPEAALVRLDAWLCDIKEMRIRDGLHTFGASPGPEIRASLPPDDLDAREACAVGEMTGLLAALDGRFVPGGPAGAPSRGRRDVMPTGRNLYSSDPRAVPTQTAYEIGRRAADEIANRHAQDHGEFPRAIVMDLWASATMRTGGEDFAQALVHLGVRPRWDPATARVIGFEILPFARLERPRADVTLRISGLFRDVFPAQITLFDQIVQAVAELDEEDDINPLAAARRIAPGDLHRLFGTAPSLYGIGLGQEISADPMIARDRLGASYLAAGSHAYGGAGAEATATGAAFATRIATADAFVHGQDMADLDLLDAAATVEAIGGFSAAAALLGNSPALYQLDSSNTSALKARTLGEDVTRAVRGRASNPKWIAGQMRHGHRGAAEIAETVDNLYGLAILSDAVTSRHFDLVFAATLGTPEVRDFLLGANPDAAQAIATRFRDAATRGFWTSRKNSDYATVAEILGGAA
ncbi:MAG: cobaltochelatase subunit CobN [Beijerinckiaceae bacterium]|nr:cobaltochelatase subunit CobN [Beijerinckiaceae bacterium]